jgi:hypothetical protein
MASNIDKPVCLLFALPQELQDMIFGYAYSNPGMKVISRHAWDAQERYNERSKREKGVEYIPYAFPGPKVSQFLVSKQFFTAAATVYMQTSLDETSGRGSVLVQKGIIAKYLTSLKTKSVHLDHLHRFTSLKTLAFVIDGYDMERIGTKYPTLHKYAEDDFTEITIFNKTMACRSLKQADLIFSDKNYGGTLQESMMMKFNIRALEALVNRSLSSRAQLSASSMDALQAPEDLQGTHDDRAQTARTTVKEVEEQLAALQSKVEKALADIEHSFPQMLESDDGHAAEKVMEEAEQARPETWSFMDWQGHEVVHKLVAGCVAASAAACVLPDPMRLFVMLVVAFWVLALALRARLRMQRNA